MRVTQKGAAFLSRVQCSSVCCALDVCKAGRAGPGSILGSASMEVLLADQKSNEENQEASAATRQSRNTRVPRIKLGRHRHFHRLSTVLIRQQGQYGITNGHGLLRHCPALLKVTVPLQVFS